MYKDKNLPHSFRITCQTADTREIY